MIGSGVDYFESIEGQGGTCQVPPEGIIPPSHRMGSAPEPAGQGGSSRSNASRERTLPTLGCQVGWRCEDSSQSAQPHRVAASGSLRRSALVFRCG